MGKVISLTCGLEKKWQIRAKSRRKNPDGLLCLVRNGGRLEATYVRKGAKSPVPASAMYQWGANVRFEIPWDDDALAVFDCSFDGDKARGTVSGEAFSRRMPWTAQRVTAQ